MAPEPGTAGAPRTSGGVTLLYCVFALSGLAGLIYESIWTHYLRLFLGHAAYAQALVLAIFMGGLAAGSWVCSRWSTRWKNPLRAYALAEAAVGIAALVFHPVYVGTLEQVYGRLVPALGSPASVTAVRWLLGGLMILPQSVLLGMTFPLMSAGILRRSPEGAGSAIATLYFTNSIGAAVGVLVSGFWLVSWLGLRGTLAVAGTLNLAVAAVVWLRCPTGAGRPAPQPSGAGNATPTEAPRSAVAAAAAPPDRDNRHSRVFLLVAMVTGASSFMYEIGWIRMLSLVLGSSTHAFELMLSAFITGLALGGLWVRRRIDALADPGRFLAIVQVAMGLLALATLPLYVSAFKVMTWMLAGLAKTSGGYALFSLGSHGIALAVMLPATFCAGTTLPLLTHVLLRRGSGERAVGAVYAWNTLGAIAGVFVAIHVGLPLLGVKGLLCLGAALDMALGVGLAAGLGGTRRLALGAAVCSVGGLVAAVTLVPLGPQVLASGVYRGGRVIDRADAVLFHRDGKTATVSVVRDAPDSVSLRTNGKTDASVGPGPGAAPTNDESTMVLAGALPLALHPGARQVANIGMGSGLTSNTLLMDPTVARVDTIEIEPLMVTGARVFSLRVPLVYSDPRSHIHFDDAKAYFSSVRQRYDLIVSEPSNPWVSGVASLFSQEFYHRLKDYLAPGGLMVQWIQLYEIDFRLVASILAALSAEYADWAVYSVSIADLLIVASPEGRLPAAGRRVFDHDRLAAELRHIGIHSLGDLENLWCGNRRALAPLIERYDVRPNSDYVPVVDQGATRTRFLRAEARELLDPALLQVPVVEMLGGRGPLPGDPAAPSLAPFQERAFHQRLARMLNGYITGGEWRWRPEERPLPPNIRAYADSARTVVAGCGRGVAPGPWFDAMFNTVAKRVTPFLPAAEQARLWRRLGECEGTLDPAQGAFLTLLRAVGGRDGAAMAREATRLLQTLRGDAAFTDYLLSVGMLGHLVTGDLPAARALYERYREALSAEARGSFRLRLLRSHAGIEGA